VSARGERKHVEKVRAIELEQVRHQMKMDAVNRGQEIDNNWELEQIRNSGFKDEWVLFLVSIPLALCFHPDTVQYVEDGFAALEQCPEWYRWMTVSIFMAIFGIRVWRRK